MESGMAEICASSKMALAMGATQRGVKQIEELFIEQRHYKIQNACNKESKYDKPKRPLLRFNTSIKGF